jgi:ligand-binding sensor domain-containing protein
MFLHAQHPYSWNLSVEDGLPSLEVYDLYQDTKGYMWIGTDKGVCKYDGTKFSYYQNKKELSEALSGIQEGPKGRIWMRNFKDQIFYVEDDSLHYFEIPQRIKLQDFLVDTKGAVWLIDKSKDSLYCYDGSAEWKRWGVSSFDSTLYYLSEGLLSLVEGADSNIYIISSEGLFKCKNDSIHFLTTQNLARKKNVNNLDIIVNTFLFKNKENAIFLLQNVKGSLYQVSQLEGDRIRVLGNSFRENFDETINHNLKFDNENTVWQLTLNAGLGPIHNSRTTSNVDTTLLLFPNEGISDFIIDREGNYWIGSLSKGVHIIPSLKIQQYTAANSVLNSNRVGLIEKRDKNALFIETEEGVVLSYNAKGNRVTDEIKISKGECKQLLWDQNRLLVHGVEYQEIHVPSSRPSKTSELKSMVVSFRNSFFYKKNWIFNLSSTGARVYALGEKIASKRMPDEFFLNALQGKFGSLEMKLFTKSLTKKSSFYGISDEINDRVLIARDDSLMCYLENALPFAILDGEGKSIRGVYMERATSGLIWVCTVNSGIYALGKDFEIRHHFTTKDGLIDNRIKKIKIDGEHLWLLSIKGIQRFTPKTKESRLYTTEDGLPTHEIKDIAIVNQKVWLSTAKGLVSFDQNMPSKNEVAPLVYIKNISIHDKDTVLSDRYNLTYEQNSITINVEGLAYRSRGAFQYKYRMLGIDTIWRYQGAQIDLMRFPQLQSGEYTFEVKAVNEDDVESKIATSVVFCIGLPYWKTWWFILSIVFFIAVIILMVIRILLRQARLENQNSNLKMEALQSQMNPHFIFNVLTAVQNLWLQHKNELAMDLQSNFAKLLRKIFQYSSKRAITIEQVEEFLNNYLNLEQIRFENGVKIDFEIEEVLIEEEYKIPPLLIQPIIENSFKHGLFHKASDRKLSIHLKREGAYLYCCVEDNGVGRKDKSGQPQVKRSSGLSTTKERLAILQESVIKAKHPDNNFKITDLKNPNGKALGTRVELWIPFVTLT